MAAGAWSGTPAIEWLGLGGAALAVSVSGGKDSTALLLWMLESGAEFSAAFADTGSEHPLTYAYLDDLRRRTGVTIATVGRVGGMRAAVLEHGGFSPQLKKWCSRELKQAALREWHEEEFPGRVIFVTGQRAEESAARAQLSELEHGGKDRTTFWRPLLRWSVADVLAMPPQACCPGKSSLSHGSHARGLLSVRDGRHESRDQRAGELLSGKGSRDPRVGARFARIRADRGESNCRGTPTFFRDHPIDEALTWGLTSHGGKRLNLWPEMPGGGCATWGLCDMPTTEDASRCRLTTNR